MELAQILNDRRMVRSFSGQPPDPAAVSRIVDAALRAPRAGNTDGWDLVVLQGDETSQFWDATTTDAWRRQSRRWPGLSRAPVVVALFSHPVAYLERYGESDKADSRLGGGLAQWPVPYWFFDSGCAAMLLLLAAVDEGLGACFLGNFRGEEELRRVLGVPDDRRYAGAVLIGVPGGNDPPSSSTIRPRRRGDAVVHLGGW